MMQNITIKNNTLIVQSEADQSDTKIIDFMKSISHVRAKW